MNNVELRKHSKYFFLASFIGIIILSIVIVWPFITALLGSVVLAYIFYPLYKKLRKKIKNKHISAFLVSALVILILAIPLLFAANTLLNEANELFFTIRDFDFSNIDEAYLEKYLGENVYIGSYFKDVLNRLSINLLKGVESFILSIPKQLLAMFVMLFVMYYLFKDGKKIVEIIKEEMPLKDRYKKNIAKKFNDTIYATIYGVMVTAIIQGLIGMIGLFAFGYGSPILWGIIMMIFAMIPIGGTAIVWLPLSIYKIATGDLFGGVGFLLYGLLIISTIDNVIKPKLIAGKSKIHPVLVLLGVLGGLKIFGLIGVVIGPLALSILVVFYELYESERHETKN